MTTKGWTNIDIRYHFIREYIEDGVVHIIFVKTDENKADPFTKSASGDLHNEHKKNYIGMKEH